MPNPIHNGTIYISINWAKRRKLNEKGKRRITKRGRSMNQEENNDVWKRERIIFSLFTLLAYYKFSESKFSKSLK